MLLREVDNLLVVDVRRMLRFNPLYDVISLFRASHEYLYHGIIIADAPDEPGHVPVLLEALKDLLLFAHVEVAQPHEDEEHLPSEPPDVDDRVEADEQTGLEHALDAIVDDLLAHPRSLRDGRERLARVVEELPEDIPVFLVKFLHDFYQE